MPEGARLRRTIPIAALAAGLAACNGAPSHGPTPPPVPKAAAPASMPTPAPPAPKAADIAALAWLAPGADPVAFLTAPPPACEQAKDMDDIVKGSNDELFSRRELGRIAFESPVLLGGAAARSGLSCAACHINGRGNPSFFIKGVSGAPGTADITSSILSKTRGDGAFDPQPIPDISLRDGRQTPDRRSPAFREKIHGLIAEEFDGGEPEPHVLDLVVAYLDGLDPAACASGEARRPSAQIDLDAAAAAADAGAFLPGLSAAERVFWLRAARSRLERVYERMAEPVPQFVRDRLLELSDRLAAAAETARSGREPAAPSPGDWLDLSLKLDEYKAQSLYDPGALKAALGG